LTAFRDRKVSGIFGNKPVIERERALGKGRVKTDKSVLAVSFNLRVKTQEEESPSVCCKQAELCRPDHSRVVRESQAYE